MRLITRTQVSTAALALALSLPVAAWAQTTTTASATTTAGQPAQSREAKVEERIADMHATLRITKTEEQQWDQFAQVMLDNAQAMDAVVTKDAANTATATAEQSLQSYAEITQQHAQNVQKLSTAFSTLYASLAPDQKKSADEMFRSSAEHRQEKQTQKQQGG
jgi:hypothetical protein